jgi:hypothetical protein
MNLTISTLLILIGVSIIAYWLLYILQGHLPQGIRSIDSGGYFAFHILAEIITAIACILGGVGLVQHLRWGNLTALAGSGMLLFTSINGLAWKEVRSKPVLSLLFIPPAIIAIFIIIYLILV